MNRYSDPEASLLLQIYEIYLSTAEHTRTIRHQANGFFIAINGALLAFLGGIASSADKNLWFYLFYGAAGLSLCALWFLLVLSYKKLNAAKYKIIHQLEERFPVKPLSEEWELLGKGKELRRYIPVTKIEVCVPIIFAFLHALFVIAMFVGWL